MQCIKQWFQLIANSKEAFSLERLSKDSAPLELVMDCKIFYAMKMHLVKKNNAWSALEINRFLQGFRLRLHTLIL